MKYKIILASLVLFFLVFTVSAQTQQSLGDFIRGEEIRLTQSHPNATYINITEIVNPNKEVVLMNLEMEKMGTDFNYTINGSISENWKLGTYLVRGVSDGTPFIFIYDFELIRGGRWAFNLNNNNFLFGIIILGICLVGLILFKQYFLSGAVIVIVGFIFVFNEVVWWISIPIILIGVALVGRGMTE